MDEAKKIYRNKPQLLTRLVDVQITVCRWGRGTGKTDEGAIWTKDRVTRMPGSGGTIVGSTYTHLLTKLAPGIIKGWQNMGLKQDIHFWFNRFPPKNHTIPKPYTPLLSPKYAIFFCNGSYIQFLSADRGLANALNADFHYFDEARFLQYDKFREIMLTLRGNQAHFGGNYYHGSMLLTSDAPRSSKSQWFNDFEKQMNPEVIELIKQTAIYVNQWKIQQMQTKSRRKFDSLAKKISEYEAYLNELRTGEVFFSRASTLDNIHALGSQTIWNFRKSLSPSDYLLSVLNEDRVGSPNSFYPLLDEDIHGFRSEDKSYIESLDIDLSKPAQRSCLWKDRRFYNPNGELDIALDYNNAINSLVVGQGDRKIYRLLNAMYVLGEDKEYLKDVVLEFCRYYRAHKNKVVNYYYDHTATPGDASGRVEFNKEVASTLKAQGWQVRMHRIPHASKHEDRFMFWLRLLSNKDERLPRFFYDLDECSQWQTSAEGAGVKQSEKGFKKDKSTETKKDKNENLIVRPEDSTHLSEAADTLLDGKFGKLLSESHDDVFIDMGYY